MKGYYIILFFLYSRDTTWSIGPDITQGPPHENSWGSLFIPISSQGMEIDLIGTAT